MQISEISQYQTLNTQSLQLQGDDGTIKPPPPGGKDGAPPPMSLLDMIPEDQRDAVKEKLDSLTEEQRLELKEKMDSNRSQIKGKSKEEVSASFIQILNEVAGTTSQTNNGELDTYG
jgi:hypothetical protein